MTSINIGEFYVTGNASDSCTDTGLDPTLSYTYAVSATYGGSSGGTGSSTSTSTYTGAVSHLEVTQIDSEYLQINWQYQGSGAGFEVEYEDTNDSGTNYQYFSNGDRATGFHDWYPGDTFSFRVRADRPDGTVSDYQTVSYTIPLSDAPSLSAAGVTDPLDTDHGTVRVTWTMPAGVDPSTASKYELGDIKRGRS